MQWRHTFNFLLQLRDVTARDQRFDWSIRGACVFSLERVYKSEQFLGLVFCKIYNFVKAELLSNPVLNKLEIKESVFVQPFLRL